MSENTQSEFYRHLDIINITPRNKIEITYRCLAQPLLISPVLSGKKNSA